MSDPQHDDMLTRAIAELRRPVAVDPAFDARVMAAVRRPAWRQGIASAARWLAEPRQVVVSPLAGLGVAAGVAALVLAGSELVTAERERAVPAPAAVAAADSGAMQIVQFVVVAPGASQVSLVGDFNDWDPGATALRSSPDGVVWSIDVPLRPGRHEYAFVVDGTRWMPDPSAPRAMTDDFGRPNSVVTVAEQAS